MSLPRAISIHLQSEGGYTHIPTDSRSGNVGRPFAMGDQSGFTSTLETLYQYFINDVPDPDEALAMDGGFLQKLHNHPDVVAAHRKRALTVAQMKWRVDASEHAADQKLAAKVAASVQYDLSRIPNFESCFLEMEDNVLTGGVGHEWRWNREADLTERPVGFKPVHKTRFIFDRLGNLALKTRNEPVWGAYLGANPSNPDWAKMYPGGKFTYHVYRRQPGMWERPEDEGYIYWGMGEDVALYYVVTFDLFVWRFELKWLEKYGLPPTTLYHQDNRPPNEVRAIATSLRGEAIRTIPMGPMIQNVGDRKSAFYDVKVDEVPSPSFQAFESYYKNRTSRAINNVLLGSADEQDKQGSESGGYSDHVSRRDSGPLIFFGWDARNIANTLTTQLIWPMVERGPFKGIPMSYCPKMVLEPKEEKDQEQQVRILGEMTKYVEVRKADFYERGGVEAPTPQEIEQGKTVGGEQVDPLDALMGGGGPPGEAGEQPGGGRLPGIEGAPPRAPIGQGQGNGNGAVAVK